MKKRLVAGAAVVSLMFAGLALAADGVQPSAGTAPSFEQMKADHIKKLDARIQSLQDEKVCAQAAKNPDEMKACWAKHHAEMKGHGREMKGQSMDSEGNKNNMPAK